MKVPEQILQLENLAFSVYVALTEEFRASTD